MNISAKDALENSDIYSAVNQISGDLATIINGQYATSARDFKQS